VTAVDTAPVPVAPAAPVTHRDRPLRRPPLPGGALVVIRVSLGFALLALWLVFFGLGLTGLQAARSQLVLYGQLRTQLADATEPIGGTIEPGTPVALIEAARIGLRYVVVEGSAAGDLRAGPGHRRDTPLPGQAGTCVLYGRATLFGGPFRHVLDLRPGDTITVTTGQGTFEYRVDGVRRAGDPLPGLLRSGGGRLTLVTAEGVSWRKGWAPNHVAYVDATLQGTAQPAPAGRLTGVTRADTAMQGDPGALVPVVLWLQVLMLACAGAAWAQVRWGGAQAWLVFIPAVLAALWGATESALQLLPNLM
jgi:sortase A